MLALLHVRQGSYSERLYRATEGSGLQGVNHSVKAGGGEEGVAIKSQHPVYRGV